jgi:hypothetical protein
MDDILRRQSIAPGQLGLDGVAAAERAAGLQQLRPGRAMNGPIDTATAQQRTVRRIDDSRYREPGDIALQGAQ